MQNLTNRQRISNEAFCNLKFKFAAAKLEIHFHASEQKRTPQRKVEITSTE
jgi:hypothetical protein